ncbi:DUF4192 family protein [Enemella sp. A6]|uniref:DUF4192 family protein n=1 Tax=Enemella sp. A6 TaxID=3440152 RepID=UPI003EB82561
MSEPQRVSGPADIVGTIPHLLSYHPTDDQLVVLALGESGSLKVTIGLNWEEALGPDLDQGPKMADYLHTRVNAATYLVAAYGPAGQIRAERLASALSHHGNTPAVFAVDTAAGTFLMSDGHTWGDPEPIVDQGDQFALRGESVAARDRQTMLDRYRPLETPTYPVASADLARRIDTSLPSVRVARCRELLDQLSQPGHQPTPDDLSELAHTTLSASVVRDSVLIDVASDPAKREVVASLFTGAPGEYRGHLAPVAATAIYYGGHGPAAQTTLQHTAEGSPHASLGKLIDASIEAAVPPESFRAAAMAANPIDLGAADRMFLAERGQSIRERSRGRHQQPQRDVTTPSPPASLGPPDRGLDR